MWWSAASSPGHVSPDGIYPPAYRSGPHVSSTSSWRSDGGHDTYARSPSRRHSDRPTGRLSTGRGQVTIRVPTRLHDAPQHGRATSAICCRSRRRCRSLIARIYDVILQYTLAPRINDRHGQVSHGTQWKPGHAQIQYRRSEAEGQGALCHTWPPSATHRGQIIVMTSSTPRHIGTVANLIICSTAAFLSADLYTFVSTCVDNWDHWCQTRDHRHNNMTIYDLTKW